MVDLQISRASVSVTMIINVGCDFVQELGSCQNWAIFLLNKQIREVTSRCIVLVFGTMSSLFFAPTEAVDISNAMLESGMLLNCLLIACLAGSSIDNDQPVLARLMVQQVDLSLAHLV
jgi:hypothetical protein